MQPPDTWSGLSAWTRRDERSERPLHAWANLRLLNTPGILVHAVRSGVLALDEAEHLRDLLAANSYRINALIADLL